MLKLYKLSDELQDIIEAFDLYKMDKEIEGVKQLERDSIENYLESLYEKENISYKVIKRKKTTTYVIFVNDPDTDKEVDVKLTLRFNNNGIYSSHAYYNITFNKDLEYFLTF